MFKELKRECFEANLYIAEHGLVWSNFGNASCLDPDSGCFAIKPSGIVCRDCKWQDMVVVRLDGSIAEGNLRPSSDSETHCFLYQHFGGVKGIVHTHSLYASAWAQARCDVPVLGTTHADFLPCAIPCTPVMGDERIKNEYEKETGKIIVETLISRKLSPAKVNVVLVCSHGPFAWGKDALDAARMAETAELLCKMAFLTKCISPDVTPLKQVLTDKHYERKHGNKAYYGQF